MLTQNVYNIAEQVNNCLLGQVKIDVKDNTPLAALMQYSLGNHDEDITSHVNELGVSPHDEAFNAALAQGVTYLQASMHRARSVVLPIVKDIMEDTQKAVTERVTSMTEYSITPRKYPTLLDVPSFVALADNAGVWTDRIDDKLPASMFPQVDFDTLGDNLATGIEKIDAAAKTDGNDPKFLKVVYEFLKENPRAYINEMEGLHGLRFVTTALWLLKAIDNSQVKQDIEISDAAAVYLATLSNWLSKRVRDIIARRERNLEKGELMLSIHDKVIIVNSDTYNKYLKAGGRPEVIMGAAISNTLLNRAQAEKESQMHLEAYDGYLRMMESQVRSMRAEAMRVILPAQLVKYAGDMEDVAMNASELDAKCREVMPNVAINPDNLYPAARQLVCMVLYPKTDTLLVLSRIDELLAANPDMDAADASTACYVSILTEFYVNQLEITPV